VIVDADKPHLQPINDPIRTLIWYASSADVDTVVVDGRLIVRGGRVTGVDEQAVIRRGAAATRRVWDEARRRGHFPVEAAPARA
jgi:5-methylthioadenosine/S-adenosylhomocysteine deaminase